MKLDNKFVLLAVASEWSNKKGLDDFLKLAKKCNNYQFIIVGKTPKDSFPNNVIHMDATDNVEELVQYYNIADCFLQLSKEETFGKVVAESLACGTPVITNRMTANPELIGERCGYVCNGIDGIIDSIEIIKTNGKEFYKSFCVKFAHDNFEMNNRINDYLYVYNELTKMNRTENG